jgi:hypothetical protein
LIFSVVTPRIQKSNLVAHRSSRRVATSLSLRRRVCVAAKEQIAQQRHRATHSLRSRRPAARERIFVNPLNKNKNRLNKVK